MSDDSGLIWPSAVTNMSVCNMTNLWLWNCIPNPWKLSSNNVFILVGNIVHSLKFELISCKIGLVFFFTMELDMRELFHCQAYDCNYHDEKLCNVSKADCIARDYILYCFQSSEALRGFWRSFLKLYMYIQIKTFMYTIISHKKRWVKYQTEMPSQIARQQFRFKQCFQQKNSLTLDIDDQKFNCDNANGHSQTGNRKKKKSASWIPKTSRKNKSNEKCLKTLFTHCQSNIYLHKRPLIVDLTDIKSWIVFKSNWWTDDFCYFNDAKFHSNISINISTQSIIWAMLINANFLKSCQLILYLEFA